MSRYETKLNSIRVAYGFDRPMQQYFLQTYDEKGEFVFEENNRGKIIEILDSCNDIPKQHIDSLLMDLPF